MKKILIVGHGRHGKDTVAEQIAECTNMTFSSSSEFACGLFVREQMSEFYGVNYDSDEECFNDRHNHREAWYYIIKNYNIPSSRLAERILEKHDIYCGMRDDIEYYCSKHLFTHVIYVDARKRVDYVDPTFKIRFDESMIIMNNNGTELELRKRVFDLIDWLKL